MTQQEVIKVLKKNKGKWLNAREITKKIGNSLPSTQNCLKKLSSRGEIMKSRGYSQRKAIKCNFYKLL